MTNLTDIEKQDLADRLSGAATDTGVLIPWDTAQLMLEGCLEDDALFEELYRRRQGARRRHPTDDEVRALFSDRRVRLPYHRTIDDHVGRHPTPDEVRVLLGTEQS